jgi:hypothetical protein
LNTWKHHAGWIRWRVGQAVTGGRAGVEGLPAELAVVGSRLMDLYTGTLTPAEIAADVFAQLRDACRLEYAPLAGWLNARDHFALLDLADGSRWTVCLGPPDGRYLHLHPGRWVPHTVRVAANTLKSAVVAVAHARLTGDDPADLAVANEARRRYLGLPPVRGLAGDSGLGAVIDLLA